MTSSETTFNDKELIARWDDYVESMGSVMGEVEHMAQQMRDRIEQLAVTNEALTAENERLEKQCEGLMQAGMNNGQALILAEAKLAKAVEFIQEVRRNGDTRLASMAIATLAEIEGEKE